MEHESVPPTRPHTIMKNSALKLPLLAGFALATGCLFSSCVDPYYTDGRNAGYRGGAYSPGYQVRTLPPGYHTERHGDRDYYQSGGSYYQQQHGGGYIVVESPRGGNPGYRSNQLIPRLPPGYRAYKDRKGTYYRSGSSYYRRQGEGYMPFTGPR